jgi:hypothetical protein
MLVVLRSSLHLLFAVLIPLPVLGCASTTSERSTVVDVTSRQTPASGRRVEVAENEVEGDEPGLLSKILGADADRDGIPDDEDQCPNHPEDRDGFQDLDGCPDPDNDADGILDVNDKCPNVPETINGFEDDDGCPDANIDRAKLAFREGATAYAQGDYVKARKYFEEAHNLDPHDMLLFNIAQSAEKQGDHQYACQRYRQWRSTANGSTSPNRIPALETCP